ncbi:DUF2157 domain-containing protein [Pontibacter sp. BAB1700]|uniref:DUF2157 domain-containing protein n=1 Tax=Pontibacter sp. BAB1700 TaxID=1144253 RepID=UPI00026BD948|nr:DUF2157 domain-containing protein [Pontibacter sp. BAB1700]EJF11499.1 hypothetical protein O71_02507 [Pontibacter sp. BAB1700]
MKSLLSRDIIYSIARHSNWREAGIADRLRKEQVYAGPQDWIKFVRLFLLGLGGSFLISGIIFFFAYNWADMHKFVKLGLIEVLVMGVTFAAVFTKLSSTVKNVLLMASTMLVGVLFAVFGQIYQTGANAYDFFLGWTMCVVLWVVVARFQPLWFIFLVLLNTTFVLYTQQVATHWSFAVVLDAMFILNAAAVVIWEALAAKGRVGIQHRWFPRLVGLAAITVITISMISALFESIDHDYGLAYLLGAVMYGAGIAYGLKVRDIFYLTALPFSAIAVVTAILVRIGENVPEIMLLLATIFVVGSITLLIQYLGRLNRQWHGR